MKQVVRFFLWLLALAVVFRCGLDFVRWARTLIQPGDNSLKKE